MKVLLSGTQCSRGGSRKVLHHSNLTHLSPVILNPELKLGCVEGNLQMKVLTKFNVNQLLLWNSLCGLGKKAFHSTVVCIVVAGISFEIWRAIS